jgi:putative membrane protein
MLTTAIVFAVLAAALHVYIFALVSLRWTAASTRKTFGTTAEEANATKEMAFNQGFYNLFLALVTLSGDIAAATGHHSVGAALVLAGAGSMLAAGLVLLVSSPSKAKAALVQLTLPLVAVVLVLVWLPTNH